jgi:hypothetical protein
MKEAWKTWQGFVSRLFAYDPGELACFLSKHLWLLFRPPDNSPLYLLA